MSKSNCPTMKHVLRGNNCTEHLAGLGMTVYVGLKKDLTAPLTANENTYGTPVFKPGTGLYKIDGKRESQKYGWSSLGFQKGYELTGTFVNEVQDENSAKVDRALNNLDIFLIFKDDEKSLILYDENRPLEADSGGIAGDTGAAAEDDRQTQYEFKLKPCKYTRLYVTEPEQGWDSLLASDDSD